MITLLTIVHLLVCVFLIFVVLVQSSKGSELGAAFGGSNQTLFGSRGAATLLNKLTTAAAIAFMLTSLALAVFHGGSVMSG
ncbi:MAG: preprotein translocase subunit SecG, partial [Nitrospirota bacterium]